MSHCLSDQFCIQFLNKNFLLNNVFRVIIRCSYSKTHLVCGRLVQLSRFHLSDRRPPLSQSERILLDTWPWQLNSPLLALLYSAAESSPPPALHRTALRFLVLIWGNTNEFKTIMWTSSWCCLPFFKTFIEIHTTFIFIIVYLFPWPTNCTRCHVSRSVGTICTGLWNLDIFTNLEFVTPTIISQNHSF